MCFVLENSFISSFTRCVNIRIFFIHERPVKFNFFYYDPVIQKKNVVLQKFKTYEKI